MSRISKAGISNTEQATDLSGIIAESCIEYPMIGDDRLNLANIKADKEKIKLEPVLCQDVLDEVVSTLRPLAAAKQLNFEVISPITRLIIHTDRRALSQILHHLTCNAVKFTDAGGISIELRRRLERESGEISTEFSIEDTGMGIRPEDLMGGRIQAMSIYGKGSVFRLVILGI